MQVDLSGLRALVTGSTKGIGFAIAQKLAASGAAVAVNGRKAADVEAALGRIRAAVTNGTLVAAMRCQSSSGISNASLISKMPTLLTRISTSPTALMIAATPDAVAASPGKRILRL
jgi:NAD(P)-dependent dehydrogenase (short-subunit alcohol dehydrogenase family)